MAEQTKRQESQIDDDTTEKPATTTRSAKEQSVPARSGYGLLFEVGQPAFTSWFRGVGVLSEEMTRFIQDRLSEDMAAWSALASCKTPEEAAECQRRFAEKATAQYAEEIAKLSQMMLDLATVGLRSFRR